MRFVDILLSIPSLLLAVSVAAVLGQQPDLDHDRHRRRPGADLRPAAARLDARPARSRLRARRRRRSGCADGPDRDGPHAAQLARPGDRPGDAGAGHGDHRGGRAVLPRPGRRRPGRRRVGPDAGRKPRTGFEPRRSWRSCPASCIAITALGFTLLGEALREALDPKSGDDPMPIDQPAAGEREPVTACWRSRPQRHLPAPGRPADPGRRRRVLRRQARARSSAWSGSPAAASRSPRWPSWVCCPTAGRPGQRRGPLRGRNLLTLTPGRAARPARPRHRDGLPGPDELAEPGGPGRRPGDRGVAPSPGHQSDRGQGRGGGPAAPRSASPTRGGGCGSIRTSSPAGCGSAR